LPDELAENKAGNERLSHDISFVYCCDLVVTFLPGQVKGILSDPQWIYTCYDL